MMMTVKIWNSLSDLQVNTEKGGFRLPFFYAAILNNLAYLRPASAGSNGPGLLGSIGFAELSDGAA
jgi:hypothetical protein